MKIRERNITFLKRAMKKKKVRIGVIVLALVLVAAALGRFVFWRKMPGNLSAQLSVQSAEAKTGSISLTISGTGTLQGGDVENVTVPEGIVIKKILVEAGEKVKKGQKIATVDRASVAKVLLEVEENLDETEDAIDDLSDDADEEGTEEYLESIVLQSERSDLKEAKEELETLLDTKTITADRAGIVGEVFVTENEAAGSSSSSDTSSSSTNATRTAAITQTSHTGTVKASSLSTGTAKASLLSAEVIKASPLSTGTVQTDRNQKTSDDGDETTITECNLSVTAPAAGSTPQSSIAETAQYTGTITWDCTENTFQPGTVYTAVIELTAKSGCTFTADTKVTVAGASSIKQETDGSTLTVTAVFPATEEASTENTESSETTGSTENTGASSESTEQSSSGTTTTENGSTAAGNNNTNSGGNTTAGNNNSTTKAPDANTGKKNTTGSKNAGGNLPASGNTGTSLPSGGGSSSGSSLSSDAAAASSTTSDDSTYETAVLSIVSEEKVIVSINVDELDILSVEEGQTAEITLDAVEDETFTGTISSVSASASGTSGSATYPVEITLDKTEDMLFGMSASATIQVEEASNALLIPVNALQEESSTTFVYTKTDEDGNLSGKTEVTTGLSDGTQVAILSGLEEGDTVYYLRTGSDSDDSTFPAMGGSMPSGDMPSGMDFGGSDFGGGVPGGGPGGGSQGPGGQ